MPETLPVTLSTAKPKTKPQEKVFTLVADDLELKVSRILKSNYFGDLFPEYLGTCNGGKKPVILLKGNFANYKARILLPLTVKCIRDYGIEVLVPEGEEIGNKTFLEAGKLKDEDKIAGAKAIFEGHGFTNEITDFEIIEPYPVQGKWLRYSGKFHESKFNAYSGAEHEIYEKLGILTAVRHNPGEKDSNGDIRVYLFTPMPDDGCGDDSFV